MAFEVLTQQLKAMHQVAGSLNGQVSSFHRGLLASQVSSPLLSGQLMLGDALKMIALLEMLPTLEQYDFDIAIGSTGEIAFEEMERLWDNVAKTRNEMREIDAVIQGLEQAIGQLKSLISELVTVADYLANIGQAFEDQAVTVQATQEQLRQNILPQLFDFVHTLEDMLKRYMDERAIRAEYVNAIAMRYKAFLPLAWGMKIKRQLKRDGNQVDPRLLLGAAALSTEFARWDKMKALLERYIEIEKGTPEAYAEAATVPLRRHKYSYARELIDQGIKAHPDAILIPQLLADSLYARERHEEEEALWQAWIDQHPNAKAAKKAVHEVFKARGDEERAGAWG